MSKTKTVKDPENTAQGTPQEVDSTAQAPVNEAPPADASAQENAPEGAEADPGADGEADPTASKVKPQMTLMTDEEHAKAFPRETELLIFNPMDRPQSVNLCNGKAQKAWVVIDGVKRLNKSANPACFSCPGRVLENIQPRETRTVNVVLTNCLGSAQVNGLLNQDRIRIRDKDGKKFKNFEV